MPTADLIDKRFDKLKVIGIERVTDHGKVWRCKCDCGNTILKFTNQLTRLGMKGASQTGCKVCAMRDRTSGKNGNCIGGKSRLYKTWQNMLDRCRRKTSQSWKWYGANGIKVCDEWDDFKKFKEWAFSHGYTNELSIDRVNPQGNYEPTNCEWVTGSENTRRMLQARWSR